MLNKLGLSQLVSAALAVSEIMFLTECELIDYVQSESQELCTWVFESV